MKEKRKPKIAMHLDLISIFFYPSLVFWSTIMGSKHLPSETEVDPSFFEIRLSLLVFHKKEINLTLID